MINVAAAIIEKEGKVLAARRKPGLHLEGYWEFPGGKLENGETPKECLQRELAEEFQIESRIGQFIGESVYDYGGKEIRLLAYLVEHLDGKFQLIDHDKLLWLTLDELKDLKWAPADIPLVQQYKIFASTSVYYRTNAEFYCNETIDFNLQKLYSRFLDHVPKNGHILDLGCGSGRDSKIFLSSGYKVTAMDAIGEIAAYASKTTGQPVLVCNFQEMLFREEFDGVWACASLLHCPRVQITDVLYRVAHSLKANGVAYMSFKWGNDETYDDNGRYFNNYTLDSIHALISQIDSLVVIEQWKNCKQLRDTEQKWVNILVRKTSPAHDKNI